MIYKLPTIIYKSIIIYKGYNNLYRNKDPQLPLHTISTRFPRTLSHIYKLTLTRYLTHLPAYKFVYSFLLL